MIQGLEVLDDFYRETGKIDEWIAEGKADGAKQTLLVMGCKRFGEPSADVLQTLEGITSAETLQQMAVRLLEVESWEELLPTT